MLNVLIFPIGYIYITRNEPVNCFHKTHFILPLTILPNVRKKGPVMHAAY